MAMMKNAMIYKQKSDQLLSFQGQQKVENGA